MIGRLIIAHPGVRVPGAWDSFELLIRVIIGQQISVAGATILMRRLVDRIGSTVEALSRSSPIAIAAVGIPIKRAETMHHLAVLTATGRLDLSERDPEVFYSQLVTIPGIGLWTAEYARLRILHWPDAFPASDLGIQKALRFISAKQAELQSQAWRPWRSYATLLLWKSVSNQRRLI